MRRPTLPYLCVDRDTGEVVVALRHKLGLKNRQPANFPPRPPQRSAQALSPSQRPPLPLPPLPLPPLPLPPLLPPAAVATAAATPQNSRQQAHEHRQHHHDQTDGEETHAANCALTGSEISLKLSVARSSMTLSAPFT